MADFMDPLPLSASLETNLKALLDSSGLLVVVWSRNAATSRWLEMEWRYFLRSPDAKALSDQNAYFFATVPPHQAGQQLCDYLCGEIDRQMLRDVPA